VLDVACGVGFGLDLLRAAGARPLGADYDHATLVEIRDRLGSIPVLRADAARLPFPTASLDAVVSFETLEHVQDGRAMVCELRRVLKPGGPLILSTPNREFGPQQRHTANPFHVREFSAEELRSLLAERFSEIQLFGQYPSPEYRYVPFLMLERDLRPRTLAWKAMLRLPFPVRQRIALAVSGRPFYPSEGDYSFEPERTQGSHALVAIAR
jgi:SAM-dependent methyltransferase